MSLRTTNCPGASRVLAFFDGQLRFDDYLILARHLRECDLCRERAARSGLPVPARTNSMLPVKKIESHTLHASGEETQIDPLRLPTRIGPYRIRGLIGRGGMGTVYEAVHELLDRPVALKVLSGPAAEDSQFVTRFRREAKAVGRLHHPNVVQPMDAGEEGGVPFLAMELLDGTDVGRLLRVLGPFGYADAADVVRQAATALAHAHDRGLVHRDVKPSNLMLTTDGVVKLLDLGLALSNDSKMTGQEARLTGNNFLGTHDYMAPEQWTDPSNVDGAADIYALGCLLYHLLTGRAPFAGMQNSSIQAKMQAHIHSLAPDPGILRPGTPSILVQAVATMLVKPRADRPTASAIIHLLGPIANTSNLPRLVERAKSGPLNRPGDDQPTILAPQYDVHGNNEDVQKNPAVITSCPNEPGPGVLRGRTLIAFCVFIACVVLLISWLVYRARMTHEPKELKETTAIPTSVSWSGSGLHPSADGRPG